MREIPRWDEDYEKKYVRTTVCETRKLKTSFRIAFSADEIDSTGNLVMYPGPSRGDPKQHKPLYYNYLWIGPKACAVWRVARLYPEVLGDWEPDRFSLDSLGSGSPFPLTFTWPPFLNPHKRMEENSWARAGEVIFYDEPTPLPEKKGLTRSVTYLEKVDVSKDPNRPGILYYSDSDKTLGKEEKPGSIPVVVSARETQVWVGTDDWLWQEMERTDSEGHITLRCRRPPSIPTSLRPPAASADASSPAR